MEGRTKTAIVTLKKCAGPIRAFLKLILLRRPIIQSQMCHPQMCMQLAPQECQSCYFFPMETRGRQISAPENCQLLSSLSGLKPNITILSL